MKNTLSPALPQGGGSILARRVATVKPTMTREMTRLGNELARQGRSIMSLAQGEPDFDTPRHVREAGKAAIDAGTTRYTDVLVDGRGHRTFRTLHTDDEGYPMNGHLIWATSGWWVEQFARAGFVRRPGVEAAIQERYRAHFEAEPARRSCYVFSAGAEPPDAAAVIDRLRMGNN